MLRPSVQSGRFELGREGLGAHVVEGGDGAMVTADVPSLKFYERVALQWRAADGFELHAREFGAPYGASDHHWHGARGDLTRTIAGQSGFVTRHGDGGLTERLMVEVYTYPSGHSQRSGDVTLSVEAEVTKDNCAQSVAAQTIEVRHGSSPRVQDLTLEMPTCDAIGDYLVLQSILEDLKIAAR